MIHYGMEKTGHDFFYKYILLMLLTQPQFISTVNCSQYNVQQHTRPTIFSQTKN
jgi:hypothetical protein